MFGGLKCHLWTHLERISCYVSTFRSKRCVDVARRDNCRLQQYDYYWGLFYSVVAKTTISNFRQVGTWPLSLAIPKTWPMCSHWPYRGECHIFLYFGYSKFRRWDRGDGIKRTEQGNHCKWRERGKKPVLSFLLFSFLFTLRFLFRTSPCYLNALISQSSNKGRTVRQGSFSCSSFKHRSVGLWVGGRKGLYAPGVGWRNIPSSYIFFEKMFVFLFSICRIDLKYNARLVSCYQSCIYTIWALRFFWTAKSLLKVFFISTSTVRVNKYCRNPVTRTVKGNEKQFALAEVRIIGVDWIFNLLCWY